MGALTLEPLPASERAAWRELATERLARFTLLPMYLDEAVAKERAATLVGELLMPTDGGSAAEALGVVDDGRQAGWIWVCRDPRHGEVQVLDVVLDDPSDASVQRLLDTLLTWADGATLLLRRAEGATTTAALAAVGGFVPTATNMALDLSRPVDAAGVRLVPLTAERHQEWKQHSIADYVRQIEESTTLDHARSMEKALADYARLLPDDLATADNFLFDVYDGEDRVAFVWLAQEAPTAYFVYEVEVAEEARGRGLGRATMNAAARWCRDRGGEVLALNVFGRNDVARGLYASLGYAAFAERMSRPDAAATA